LVTLAETRLGSLRRASRERSIWPGLMIGAAVVTSIVVLALLVVIFWLSLTEGTPGGDLEYSFAAYTEVFASKMTYRVLWNTLLFSFVCLGTALVLALPIAWLVERTDLPGKPVVFTFMTIGLLLPGFSVALGWMYLLHPRIGVINKMLMSGLGLEEAPFNVATIMGMGLINGLTLAPLAFIMTAVVLRAMDSSLEEAAKMSGANLWQTLTRITLPLAWPGILAASIYVFTIGFAAFDVPAILGLSNKIYTFSTFVFQQVSPFDGLPEYGVVATLSVIMVALAAVLTWWYTRLARHAQRYAVVTGKGYRPNLVKLGTWKWTAIAFIVLFFVLNELLPVVMLAWTAFLPYLQTFTADAIAAMSLRNFETLPRAAVIGGLESTVKLMVLVPTITVFLSLGISWAVLRSKVKGRSIFDFFAFLPHCVPSICFSVAAWLLALFVLRDALPIYGTIWILVLVYVIARVSYGTRMTNGALMQIHKELEESATVSGAATGGVLRSVIVPLLTPAMMYAWIWMALLTYRELTLPVILSTTNTQPLSVVVWGLVYGSHFGHASVVALLMVALMLPILAVYWIVARRTGMIATS
jgi:iron(III) transport system permease protein